MMTGTCDICKSTGETIKYVKDKREYNLCRDCLKKKRYMYGVCLNCFAIRSLLAKNA